MQDHSPKHTERGGERRFDAIQKNGKYRFDETYNKGEHTGSPLPNIVQWFKTMTTHDTF